MRRERPLARAPAAVPQYVLTVALSVAVGAPDLPFHRGGQRCGPGPVLRFAAQPDTIVLDDERGRATWDSEAGSSRECKTC